MPSTEIEQRGTLNEVYNLIVNLAGLELTDGSSIKEVRIGRQQIEKIVGVSSTTLDKWWRQGLIKPLCDYGPSRLRGMEFNLEMAAKVALIAALRNDEREKGYPEVRDLLRQPYVLAEYRELIIDHLKRVHQASRNQKNE